MDVCFGSDDKLAWEDALIEQWPELKTEGEAKMGESFWKGAWFDNNGKFSDTGKERFPSWVNYHQVFKHARYIRRYAKLGQALANHMNGRWRVRIQPVAIGVMGLIPSFTRRYLADIIPKGEVKALTTLFIQTTQRAAIQVWRAWKDEGGNLKDVGGI